MKRICILLPMLLLRVLTWAQIDSSQYWHVALTDPNADFYQVFNIQSKWFEAHPDPSPSESSSRAMFDRWAWFWGTRVDNTGSQPGNVYSAFRKFQAAYDNISNYYPDDGTSGADWRFLGPKGLSTQNYGIVTSIALDPQDATRQTIFAGTGASGLWKTTDGGVTWRNITGYSIPSGLGVNDIIIDPMNSDKIYLALGMAGAGRSYTYGRGILTTNNGGDNWVLVELNYPAGSSPFISKLLLNPHNYEQLLAFGKNYIFRVNLSNNTWELISNVPDDFCSNLCEGTYVNWIGLKTVVDAEVFDGDVYVSTDGFSYDPIDLPLGYCSAKLWKIEDAFRFGQPAIFTEISLSQVSYTSRIMLDQTPQHPDKLFIGILDDLETPPGGVEVEYLGPNSVTPVQFCHTNTPLLQGTRWMFEFEMSETDPNRFYTTVVSFFSFEKDGLSADLKQCYPSNDVYHDDTRAMFCVADGDSEYIYFGTDGGVSKAKREINNPQFGFENLDGRGLYITQFYGLSTCLSSPDHIAGGTQDNRLHYYSYSGTNEWKIAGIENGVSDAYKTLIKPDDPESAYYFAGGGSITGGLFKTDDGFVSKLIPVVGFTPDDNSKSILKPIVANPQNPNIVYAGFQNVYKSNNWNEGFNIFFNRTTDVDPDVLTQNTDVSCMAICEEYPNVMYIAYQTSWPGAVSYLVKTTNAQSSNPDWTCLVHDIWPGFRWFSYYYGITDIAVAPDDPDKVWISFGTFYKDQDGWRVRIAYSDDGGTTFTYPSDGLENLPINCLSVSGSGEEGYNLFCGNDIGVFKFDFTSQEWVPFNKNLPPAVVTDIEYIPGSPERLRISTYGYGIWETPLECMTDANYEIISTEVMWDSDVIKHHNVYIAPGGILTVTAKASFVEGTGITVQPGGRLVVNGGSLTSACGSLWNGVVVVGDPTRAMNITYQGVAEFYNALVENAIAGVRTAGGLPDFIPGNVQLVELRPNPSGGIIKAFNTSFRNNFIGALINPCLAMKIDQFHECIFETTSEVLPPYNESGPLVTLKDVNMVHFQACTYRASLDFSPGKPEGIGILSYNSNFEVDPVCIESDQTGCIQWEFSEFSNLDYGVKNLAFSPDRTFIIDRAHLVGNNTGIYASATSFAQITRCNFDVLEVDTNVRDHSGGLYLDVCNGYTVEENTFTGINNDEGYYTIGIVVNNSNIGSNLDADNEIYNNTFNNLNLGILAENKNRNDNGDYGLLIKCNDFTNYKYDIAVTTDNPNFSLMGIRMVQGQSGTQKTFPAGNGFSDDQTIIKPIDFRYHNEGGEFTYYHHDQTGSSKFVDPNPDYTQQGPSKITLIPSTGNSYTSDDECCPSKLSPGGGGGGSGIEDLRIIISEAKNNADSAQNLLNLLVDGGSTNELKTEVDLSSPPVSYEVYSELLTTSPYLSDTVLVAAINKEDVLSSAMVTDILSENPQSAKSDTVLTELSLRTNQLSVDQMDQVMQGMYITGAMEDLQAEIAGYRSDYSSALTGILRHYTVDTLNLPASDSILAYTLDSPYLWAKYLRIFKLAQTGNNTGVDFEMDELPTIYGFSNTQNEEHNGFAQLLEITKVCADSGMSILEADSSDLSVIGQIHQTSNGIAKSYAQNVLRATQNLQYHEPYILPTDGLKDEKIIWYPQETYSTSELKVYPNPSGTFVIIEYTLRGECCDCQLRFIDNTGKVIKSFNKTKSHDYLVVPVNDLPAGIYLIELTTGTMIAGSVKLVVSH